MGEPTNAGNAHRWGLRRRRRCRAAAPLFWTRCAFDRRHNGNHGALIGGVMTYWTCTPTESDAGG